MTSLTFLIALVAAVAEVADAVGRRTVQVADARAVAGTDAAVLRVDAALGRAAVQQVLRLRQLHVQVVQLQQT